MSDLEADNVRLREELRRVIAEREECRAALRRIADGDSPATAEAERMLNRLLTWRAPSPEAAR